MLIFEYLLKKLSETATYNSEAQEKPACILWPDRDCQWEAVIGRLQAELPELFVLGEYDPEKRTGPAIWLRCVVAGNVEAASSRFDSSGKMPLLLLQPILYLPGVSRQDLRAVENCPDHLKPLAELQFRGVIWSQVNARDWTILAFLKSEQSGLGLDVAQDNEAKNAMQLALKQLLDEEIETLRGKHLDKEYFYSLLSGGDPIRDLLQWIDQGDEFRKKHDENEWYGFIEVCKSQFSFNPDKDGMLTGAAKLAIHEGPWQPVWERFCEAPRRYPNIPDQIRKCKMPDLTLLSNVSTHGGWPQWNEQQETLLRLDLQALVTLTPHTARVRIKDLEKRYSERRKMVWAELGEAPLCCALEYLNILAEVTSYPLASGEIDDMVMSYTENGWRADDTMLRALVEVNHTEDYEVIKGAIRSIYLPWVEESARYVQKLIDQKGYPGGDISARKEIPKTTDECILFVDGLRYDMGRRLTESLLEKGFKIVQNFAWAALPTVTATGKPAVSPVRERINGNEVNIDFEPSVAETDQSLRGGHHFKKLLIEAGWQYLEKSETGDGKGNAWCELSNIDQQGHEQGWKLAKTLDSFLIEIEERIERLLNSGWKQLRVVTDHGWLLMPGGLPKIDLPPSLTENKWGRCAVLKPNANSSERLYPWYWNPIKYFALADGISCYRSGEEYAHGGISLQECLTLELIITRGEESQTRPQMEITKIEWKGLRCTVAVTGKFTELSLDIRTHPGDASSSIVSSVKPFNENSSASVVVENDEMEGHPAIIVVLGPHNDLITQIQTIIGGGVS